MTISIEFVVVFEAVLRASSFKANETPTSYPGSYLRSPSRCGKTLVGAGHVTP
jgi:hypothetical protein